MPTINSIINELKEVPVNQLEEVYQLVHSLSRKVDRTESRREKILSFAGSFSDMSNDEYADFLNYIQESRKNLFNRDIEL
jgi:hypothetical protein